MLAEAKHHFFQNMIMLHIVLYRRWIIIADQSKISFDSTNRLCLVIIDYNRKESHLTLVRCYSNFATLLQENARFIEYK